MGCDYYYLEKRNSEAFIRFSEDDDEYGCLCTFPHNDEGTLSIDRIRSLALLGASVVLAHHDEISLPIFLPHGIPKWILDEIDRNLPNELQEKETQE